MKKSGSHYFHLCFIVCFTVLSALSLSGCPCWNDPEDLSAEHTVSVATDLDDLFYLRGQGTLNIVSGSVATPHATVGFGVKYVDETSFMPPEENGTPHTADVYEFTFNVPKNSGAKTEVDATEEVSWYVAVLHPEAGVTIQPDTSVAEPQIGASTRNLRSMFYLNQARSKSGLRAYRYGLGALPNNGFAENGNEEAITIRFSRKLNTVFIDPVSPNSSDSKNQQPQVRYLSFKPDLKQDSSTSVKPQPH